MAELPGSVGRYRIEGLLGAGTFATVYRGRDEALDVPVAVKVLAQNWSFEPDIRRRFIQEAQLLRRADGTRVVRVHDIGQTDDGQPYFVMDFADRATTEDRLAALAELGRTLQVEDVLRFARQLASGVAEVHRLGVVHRDLKPSNLLLRSTGEAVPAEAVGGALVGLDERLVVADLGLARDLLGPTRLTVTVGTPGFMAPEQFDPAAKLDERTDLYACTAILHSVLTGQAPAADAAEAAADASVPPEVRALLARGLAEDPGDRFASTDEWLRAVEAALDTVGADWQSPPTATPFVRALSSLGRATPAPRRRSPSPVSLRPTDAGSLPPTRRAGARRGLLVGIAVLVTVTLAGGGLLVLRSRDDSAGTTSTTRGAIVGTGKPPGLGAEPAAEAILVNPGKIEVGDDGHVYFVEPQANRVRRLDGTRLGTVAGTGTPGRAGIGGAATGAQLFGPTGFARADDGTLYIADLQNALLQEVSPAGTLTTIAGGEGSTAAQPGMPAIDAPVSPLDVAVAPDGTVAFVDSSEQRVWGIDEDGDLVALAGSGAPSPPGPVAEPRRASDLGLVNPASVAFDGEGLLYVTDAGNGTVWRIDDDGAPTRVAGTGRAGFSGDGGPATDAALDGPDGITVTDDGAVYVADTGNNRIRRIDPGGTIDTVAGTGDEAFSGDDGPATDAALSEPAGVAVDGSGRLWIADTLNNRIRVVEANGTITTAAGSGNPGSSGDNNPADAAPLADPEGLAVTSDGILFVEGITGRLRRIAPDGILTTLTTVGITDPALAPDAGPVAALPSGLALAADGTLLVTDLNTSAVLAVAPGGASTVFAGDPVKGPGFSGDGGPATAAQLDTPLSAVVAPDGAVVVADTQNNRLRRVAPDGTITSIAGTGSPGGGLESGPASQVSINGPAGVAVAPDGTIFFTEVRGDLVRSLAPDGTATSVAGTGRAGSSGDGGPAAEARLDGPYGIAVGPDGELYVAENAGNRVRRIDPDGTITTVAGTGRAGFGGDGGPADSAALNRPTFLAVASGGALLIADSGNNRVRRVDSDGTITTVAGAF